MTIIILALIFDYINGFHDAANSIATIVSTRVLTPFQAVIWAAFFNFVAFFIAKYIIGGFGIANTVSKTVVEQYITLPIILAGVIAAITWNLVTWWKGIPSSSSHTLIGGFAGAAIMANGFEAIQLNIILKIAAFIFLAPFIGMVIAFGFTLFVLYICRRAHPHMTGDEALAKEARKYTDRLQDMQYYTGNHDLGFMMFCSYGQGIRLKPEPTDSLILIHSSESLCSRFRPEVGLIRSWDFGDWSYPAIL